MEENVPWPFSETGIISNCIPNIILLPIAKFRSHPSNSKMLLFVAGKDNYGTITGQNAEDNYPLCVQPNWYNHNTNPTHKAYEIL